MASTISEKLSRSRLYYRVVCEIAAFVLAGGKSSRMGCDKAFLHIAGHTLLARALELAQSVSKQTCIVGDPSKFSLYGPVESDVYVGHGPLGGIHAALIHSRTDMNLMLAVDLPFLTPELLMYIVSRAQESSALVTVPFIAGRYQPMCAVYRREFLGVAESALRMNQNKIDATFTKVSVCAITEQELVRVGFSVSAFRNVNTPEEWESAKRQLESLPQHL